MYNHCFEKKFLLTQFQVVLKQNFKEKTRTITYIFIISSPEAEYFFRGILIYKNQISDV